MSYPEPPWHLQGHSFQTLHFVDRQQAQTWIPDEFEILSVWPGKTIGGVYLATYGPGSVLQYHELIVVPGFISYGGQIGAWISHIYVDNTDSLAGGREIWGLPKELADFQWGQDSIEVSQDGQILCQLSHHPTWLTALPNLPTHLSGNVFSKLNDKILLFEGQFKTQAQLVKGILKIPRDSPFHNLGLKQPWLTTQENPLQLDAKAPNIV